MLITATKRETNIQTTPAAVSAYSTEALQDAGISNIQDLQKIAPGLIISGNSGQEMPIALRGISSGQQGPGGDSPVAIYLDGVYIGRPLGSLFEFANIQRVEVLRGPQGTLYGRNVTGGAINIITKAPSDQFTGSGLIRYGTFNEFLVNGAVSGQVWPGFSASLAGSVHRDDGADRRISDGAKRNGQDSSEVNFGLKWNASSNLTFDLRGDFSRASVPPDSRPLTDSFTGYGPSTYPLSSNAMFVNEDSFETVTTGGAGLTTSLDFAGLTLRSITAYRAYKQEMLIDNDLLEYRVQRFGLKLDENQFSQELNLSNTNPNRLSWLLGAYYYRENSSGEYGIQSFGALPASASDTDTLPENSITTGYPRLGTKNYAFFADGTIHITEKFGLGLGARYSHEEKTFYREGQVATQLSSTPAAKNPAPRLIPLGPRSPVEYDARDSWNAFTPRLSLEYKVNDDHFTYLSAQKGFKSGGYSFSAGGPIPNPSFAPEKIIAYELGVKSDWFGHQFRTDIVAFAYDYTGLQVALATSPAVRSIFNAAAAKVNGAELEMMFVPKAVPGLRLSGNATYMPKAEYTDFLINLSGYTTDAQARAQCPGGVFTAGVRTCDLSGYRMRRAPKMMSTLIGEYDIRVSNGAKVTPRIQLRHQDSIFYNEQNILDASSGSFTDIDARLTYTSPDGAARLSLYGNNLTDERHVNQATAANVRASLVPGPAILATGATGTLGTVNRPRTYGLEMSYRL